ncbi:MAG: hypothetical protein EXS20_04055 [Opitutales bacterium]|nr:hypothetical protein [Opitutales bacterium]
MSTVTPTSKNRKGFSLILSLTMMAMIVFVVVILAAFLNVESRAAATFHLATRARLNALMSGRLALAHLQQTAGPDRRATATGDLAGVFSPPSPYVATLSNSEKISQGQRNWTGVWRTDKPDQPPAWLISGKGGQDVTKATTSYTAQSVSTWGKDISGNDITDYNNTYWLPWTTDYPINPTAPSSFAVLVGNGSAVLEPGTDGKYGTSDDVDGRIALPKIPVPGISQGITIGNYAYWIGDEGVKARINLQDSRDLTGTAPTSSNVINALRSPGRLGTELITGLTGVAVNQAELNQITSTQQLALVPGYTATTLGLDSRKLSFHNQTLWSSGVLADSFRGGLKRDLSLAFEMDDYDFDNSDFGSGAKGGSVAEVTAKTKGGSVTEFYDTTLIAPALRNSAFPELGGNTNTSPTVSSTSPTDPKPRVWVPMYEAGNNNPGRALTSGTNYFAWSPVFIREDSVAKKRFVGPLWHVIRDYYRLYKEIDWASDTATLPARSFFPNTLQFVKGNYSNGSYRATASGMTGLPQYDPFEYEAAYSIGPYGYPSIGGSGGGSKGLGKLYPGASHGGDSLGYINPVIGRNANSTSPDLGFIPRAARSAYMPNLHRVTVILSVRKSPSADVTPISGNPLYNIYLVCTPVVVIHNPYNVKLNLKSSAKETNPNTIGKSITLAISGLDQTYIDYPDHARVSNVWQKTYTTGGAIIGRYMRSILNCRKVSASGNDASQGEYESLLTTIPETTLEPGEFAVFSSKKLLDNNSLLRGSGNGGNFNGNSTVAGNSELNRATSDGSSVWILPLEKGFWYTGGFTGLLPWSSTDFNGNNFRPATYFSDDEFKCSVKFGTSTNSNGYWKSWTTIVSGWKGNKAGVIDQVNDDPVLDPGYLEILGTSKYSSTASSGQTIYIGAYETAGTSGLYAPNKSFYGDTGANPGANVIVKSRVDSITDITKLDAVGDVFGVIDTRFRVADTKRDTPYDRTVQGYSTNVTKVAAPHPAWLFTNPLASFSSNTPLGGLPAIGNASLRTQLYGGDQLSLLGGTANWSNILCNDFSDASDKIGAKALGGISHEAQGANSVIEIEIPQTAPVSIGQLMHANVSTSDLLPYRTVGNSFPNTVVPLDKSWTYGTPYTVTQYTGGATFADMSYLMNNALWDNFFFSGAAPVLKSSKTGNYNSVRSLKAQDVLNNFANGTGKLANPSMRLYQPFGISDAPYAFGFTGDATSPAFINTASPTATSPAPDGWKKMSSYLLNDGAFNVNSTSVEAWTALYASLKGLGIGSNDKTTAQFPRIIGPTGQAISESDLKKSSYWNGFINLSDTQIKALAVATVAEVKARAKFFYRTERDQDYTPLTRRFLGFPAGQEPATPLLGMCEFINRFLGPTKKFSADITYSLYPLPTAATSNTGAAYPDNFPATVSTAAASPEKYKWMIRSGVLESAIARADKTLGSASLASTPSNGAIIDPAISHNWKNNGATNGGSTGMPPGLFWRNIEILTPEDNTNRTHNGFGAAGCLFQGDLLQALGPRLATRSDTFTIRAYGEATDNSGANANCVIELVVQRTPDYIDNKTQPHERIEDLKTTNVSKSINSLLGRRFVIISARWLAKSEI